MLNKQRLVSARSRRFARRTERLSVSKRWSAWIPVRHPGTSLDPAVTVQTPRTRMRSVSSVPPPAATITDGRVRRGGAQRNTEVEHLSTLKSVTRARSAPWVSPAELWWTHNKSQRLLFTRGRRLENAVTCLCRARLRPSGYVHGWIAR